MSREVKPCGTRAAYYRHKRNGETPCQACVDAKRAADRETWHRRPDPSCGSYGAYQRHLKAGEEPCDACRRAAAGYRSGRRRAVAKSGPVELPTVVQAPGGLGPCTVPANGFVWDPIRDDETPRQARARHRVARAICVTSCPVFDGCGRGLRVSGVVAGELPRSVS